MVREEYVGHTLFCRLYFRYWVTPVIMGPWEYRDFATDKEMQAYLIAHAHDYQEASMASMKDMMILGTFPDTPPPNTSIIFDRDTLQEYVKLQTRPKRVEDGRLVR